MGKLRGIYSLFFLILRTRLKTHFTIQTYKNRPTLLYRRPYTGSVNMLSSGTSSSSSSRNSRNGSSSVVATATIFNSKSY